MKITPSDSAYQKNPDVEVSSFYMQKCGILYILPEERSRMGVYSFFFLVFPTGWSYRSSGPRILQKGSFERKLKVLVLFLSGQKIGR